MTIYLDYNSSSPPLSQVKNLLDDLLSEALNPSSVHSLGQKAKNLAQNARSQISQMLGISAYSNYKIIFTSSGTECNNLIIHSFNDADIFISSIEHASLIIHSQTNCNIKLIRVNHDGLVDLEHLETLLTESRKLKKLVSVMLANNETGVIQPIKEISNIAKKFNAYVHTDASQAPGKILVDLVDLEVNFCTISAHKFGGLTGCGALVVDDINLIKPLIKGGGQEWGLRSGTENIIAISSCGLAATYVNENLKNNALHMQNLIEYFEAKLLQDCNEIIIIGRSSPRLPNTSLIIMPLVKSEVQLLYFDIKGIAISSGAACSSGKVSSSHILKAMNIDTKNINSAIRVSIGFNTTKFEIDYFIKTWLELYNQTKHLNIN